MTIQFITACHSETSDQLRWVVPANEPTLGHCAERSDEAIQLDRDECASLGGHGALRAPRDDNRQVHQQRSEESSRSGVTSASCNWILRVAQDDSFDGLSVIIRFIRG